MQNHLFIGLGGQGGRTLGELRKVMARRPKDADSLRERGVQTRFLAIDSSHDVRSERRSWTLFGSDLALDPSDWLILERPAAGTIGSLALRPDIAPWIGDRQRLEGFLDRERIQGANQRRRFGRLLFAYNATAIRGAIMDKVNAVTSGRPYQCAFHIFATLGGGTGSGGLVDLVTMIRTRYTGGGMDQFPIFVYVYVTDADENGANVGYFFQNQLTALRDLNALICGRMQPQMLGEDVPVGCFDGAEPIVQLILSGPLNSANHQIGLETQLQIIAEACFERIVALSSGQMSTDAQRAQSGEDILAAFPAEPPGLPERSYRFGALGMRRWEVPGEKLKELLALDLLVGALRQMLFNHWHETDGFVDQLTASAGAEVGAAVSSLLAGLSLNRQPAPGADELVRRLRDALKQQAIGLARTGGPSDASLQAIEQGLADFYRGQFERDGVDELIREREASRSANVRDAVAELERRLTRLWEEHGAPLALARISQALEELAARLRAEADGRPGTDAGAERRERVIQARRLEWDKLTWLSGALTSLRRRMVDAHTADCSLYHELDLRARLARLDQAFVKDLLGRLVNIKSRFMGVQQTLQRLLDAVQQERDLVAGELHALNRNAAANCYELEPNALEAFRTWMRRHAEHQQNVAYLMRTEITRAIGTDQPLPALDGADMGLIDERLRRIAKEQAERIHDDYEVNRSGQPILEDDVLDILERRYREDRQGFVQELQTFLGQAAVCLHQRQDMQPALLFGSNIGVPNMPKRLLLIGLPRHAFKQTLEDALRAALHAGQDRLLEVFEHDDPGQIRLLTIDYWMAARFATVVKSLADKYQATMTENRNPDTRYFCNIDPDGEEARRPDLLLPGDATLRRRYEAELWLGQQSGIDLVRVDDNGVFLIRRDADGEHPELLGADLEAAVAAPDYPKMFSLHGHLAAALSGFDRQRFAGLLTERRNEIKRQHGLTSPEYQRWDQMLTLLKTLVD